MAKKENKIEKIESEIKKSLEQAENQIEGNIKRKKWFSNETFLISAIAVLIAILAVLSLFPGSLGFIKGNADKKYSVDVIKIENPENKELFSLSLVSQTLSQINNINIKSEKTLDYNSAEAQKLISKYSIKKIPAMVLTSRNLGKIALDSEIFRTSGNSAVFDSPVPYYDLNSGGTKGIISIKEVVDSSCKECASLSKISNQLKELGVKINNYEIVDSSSEAGKKLISENNIIYLPSLLSSKELSEYWWIFPRIESAFEENKEYYKFSQETFPYKDIKTGVIKGKVNAVYIVNRTCEDCFNETQLKSAFQSVGIYIDEEDYADINTAYGKSLLIQYNITAIPTVVFSKEINDYDSLKPTLEKIGSFENDKKFVFRKVGLLQLKYQQL